MSGIFNDDSINEFARLQALVKGFDAPTVLTDKELTAIAVNGNARRLGFRVGDGISSCLCDSDIDALKEGRLDNARLILDCKGAQSAHVRTLDCGFCFSLSADSDSDRRKDDVRPCDGELLEFCAGLDESKREEGLALRQLVGINDGIATAVRSAAEGESDGKCDDGKHFDPVHPIEHTFDAVKRAVGDGASEFSHSLSSARCFCIGAYKEYRKLMVDMLSFIVPFCKGRRLTVSGDNGIKSYRIEISFDVTKRVADALGGLGVAGGLLKTQLDYFGNIARQNGWQFVSERRGTEELLVLEMPLSQGTLYVLRKPVPWEGLEDEVAMRLDYFFALAYSLKKL